MKLPASLSSYVALIRVADRLKVLRAELLDTKDRDIRKKLNINIRELEAFFDESKSN